MNIKEILFSLQDLKYREFHKSLIPGSPDDYIIGVRTPELRNLAKETVKSGETEEFLKVLPHRYYEENQIHAFIISEIKDFKSALSETERFLPYVNNWATCDQLRPKIFKKHSSELLPKIDEWISSSETYTIRFGIGMLMTYFLDADFKPEYNEKVISVVSSEYYVNMMRAWYFATALAKQYDETVRIFEEKRLDKWTHNKAVQKARESFRVSDEHKEYLNGLKIK